jgi:hypothetical protein
MLRVNLIDPRDGAAVKVEKPYDSGRTLNIDARTLLTIDPHKAYGTFKSANITSATTTVITTPPSNGSLILTDLVVSADKVNNTTLTLQFNDGSNTALIASPDTVNDAVNFAWSPSGRIQGWRDSRIEVITGGAGVPDVTVTCGYVRLSEGLNYAEWDALRG